MSLFLLIRHGTTDMVDRMIAGRMPGVDLNEEGRAQADRLAQRAAHVPIGRIVSSPLERTIQTASPVAARLGIDIHTCEAVNEVDFGIWTGRAMADLADDPEWSQFNLFRTGTRIPGGELMVEVQTRMVAQMELLRRELPNGIIAIVSHGDVIKSAIAHYAGIPLDLFLRIIISPASVSVISVEDYGPRIIRTNDTGDLLTF